MKVILGAAAVAVAFCLAGAASAQGVSGDNYGEVSVGAGVAGRLGLRGTVGLSGTAEDHGKVKAGLLGAALVGHDFRNGLSVEVEGFYARNNIDTDDLDAALGQKLDVGIRSFGGMANLKLELPSPYVFGDLNIVPYVAVGGGYGRIRGRALGVTDSQGGFNWQAKAGLAMHVSPDMTWDLGYRYLTTAKYRFDDGAGDRLEAREHIHAVTLGARVAF